MSDKGFALDAASVSAQWATRHSFGHSAITKFARALFCCAVVALAACSSGGGSDDDDDDQQPAMVAVPDVVGETQSNAENQIVAAGLIVGTVTMQASVTVPADEVISQNPAGATMVADGSAVDLVVSNGPPMVAVPDVVGETQTNAENQIVAAGLIVGTVTMQASVTVPAGNVISQNPAGATMAVLGSAVDLVVSNGPPIVAVPNVVGETQSNAENQIVAAGLIVGTVTMQASLTVPADEVISQNPAGATMAVLGSAVDLVVSTGPTIVEIIDPTPGAGDYFGDDFAILANGNVVVSDPFDDGMATNGGAVHLYDPLTQTLVDSIYGDNADDNLGSMGIRALTNGNFVVVSPMDDVGGVSNAGSVRLVDGSNGNQLAEISGDDIDDLIGSGEVWELPNGNFVVASPDDKIGLNDNAGSVRLYSGTDGMPIGTPIEGDDANDQIGSDGIEVLANGNYVVVSPNDNEGAATSGGSIRLVDSDTGNLIGTPFFGDVAGDRIGSDGVIPLNNGNFVVFSPSDNEGFIDNGSVRLFDGTNNTEIASFSGNSISDRFGDGLGDDLPNGNFVFAAREDNVGSFDDAGSVTLVDGISGAPIGATIEGTSTGERLGYPVALGNNNFVVASPLADVAPGDDTGSVRLFNTMGVQLGLTLQGNTAGDQLGSGDVVALSNNNYVVTSPFDDDGAADGGSIRVFDGDDATPVFVGAPIVGDDVNDHLGSGQVVALDNGNFVVASPDDNDGVLVVTDAGSVRLVNGDTGDEIAIFFGDNDGDKFGEGDIFRLPNGNFVFTSPSDDTTVVDGGSVLYISGLTGQPIGAAIEGTAADDIVGAEIDGALGFDYFIVALPLADNNGVDSGKVLLIAE